MILFPCPKAKQSILPYVGMRPPMVTVHNVYLNNMAIDMEIGYMSLGGGGRERRNLYLTLNEIV